MRPALALLLILGAAWAQEASKRRPAVASGRAMSMVFMRGLLWVFSGVLRGKASYRHPVRGALSTSGAVT